MQQLIILLTSVPFVASLATVQNKPGELRTSLVSTVKHSHQTFVKIAQSGTMKREKYRGAAFHHFHFFT